MAGFSLGKSCRFFVSADETLSYKLSNKSDSLSGLNRTGADLMFANLPRKPYNETTNTSPRGLWEEMTNETDLFCGR